MGSQDRRATLTLLAAFLSMVLRSAWDPPANVGGGRDAFLGFGGHVRILCAGDLHLGRRSSRVPWDGDGAAGSCAEAWMRLVECAIRERVDLVALSGDLVDHDNRWFEAFGPLERGLKRLADAGIPVYAVAGNHDYDTLPHLRSEEHTSELQSRENLVCRLLPEKKNR